MGSFLGTRGVPCSDTAGPTKGAFKVMVQFWSWAPQMANLFFLIWVQHTGKQNVFVSIECALDRVWMRMGSLDLGSDTRQSEAFN